MLRLPGTSHQNMESIPLALQLDIKNALKYRFYTKKYKIGANTLHLLSDI
jgi:hypothetical protein